MSTKRPTTHRWMTALVIAIGFVVMSFLLGIWLDEERWINTAWVFVAVAGVPAVVLMMKYLEDDF